MVRKKGLGRSIKDIFGENWVLNDDIQFFLCPINRLSPNPVQPRKYSLDDKDLEKLAASIKKKGILQPLVVSKTEEGDSYFIIAGERRWRAAKIAGISEVPVIVKDVSPSEKVELALIENIQRKDLSCIEEALAYRQLQEEFGLTQEEIASRVGKSRSGVANILRLLSLPETIQQAIVDERLTMGHARALLSLPSAELQEAVRNKIINNSLSVRETERLVKKLLTADSNLLKEPDQKDDNGECQKIYEREENILREFFKTKVKIKRLRKKVQIVIDFESEEKLREILSVIVGEENENSGY